MSSKNIRIVVILAAISILGISVAQYIWFKKAFDLRERQFNYNVTIALKNVGESITQFNQSPPIINNPVNQISGNYFVVRVNDAIDANLLEQLLINQFQERGLNHNFEYGIYDCTHEKMVYGNYIRMNETRKNPGNTELPKWQDDSYYFGVFFPEKNFYLLGQMNIWLFSSFVLLIVILFFVYTLFIILRQKRLSEIQKDFINNMTHEFKTPISTISISSEVLKQEGIEQDPQKLQQYAGIIHQESTRLKNHVERILEISKHNSTDYSMEEVDMHQLLEESVLIFQSKFVEAGGSISMDLKSDPARVYGDPLHLSNALFNLIDNALKYSGNRPELRIQSIIHADTVELRFIDHGVGIEKKYQKRIFDRFFRVPTGKRHDAKGFGLGLNYVREVVRKHNGKLSLISQPGKGSEFTLNLRLL